jgi:hypothetical protein
MRNFQFPTAEAPRRQGKGERGGKNRSIAIIVTWCKLKMGKVLGSVARRRGRGRPGSLEGEGRDDPAR